VTNAGSDTDDQLNDAGTSALTGSLPSNHVDSISFRFDLFGTLGALPKLLWTLDRQQLSVCLAHDGGVDVSRSLSPPLLHLSELTIIL
jgi:hypothetical protein